MISIMSEMITRFAPSPTGFLHLGHGFSAFVAHQHARRNGGRFLLRIEDIDHTRARPEFVSAIPEDLAWLGIDWQPEIRHQSEHFAPYKDALARLQERGLAYPCFCSRKDIRSKNPVSGHDGFIYPGTCRTLSAAARADKLKQSSAGDLPPPAWRLNLQAALSETGPIHWMDLVAGPQHWDGTGWGDVILARRDIGTSYHIAVTIDDAVQGVTDIVRGQDLFHSTHIHRVLQILLDLPEPRYLHHPLLIGEDGRRLAKTHASRPLRDYRNDGVLPDTLIADFPPFPLPDPALEN